MTDAFKQQLGDNPGAITAAFMTGKAPGEITQADLSTPESRQLMDAGQKLFGRGNSASANTIEQRRTRSWTSADRRARSNHQSSTRRNQQSRRKRQRQTRRADTGQPRSYQLDHPTRKLMESRHRQQLGFQCTQRHTVERLDANHRTNLQFEQIAGPRQYPQSSRQHHRRRQIRRKTLRFVGKRSRCQGCIQRSGIPRLLNRLSRNYRGDAMHRLFFASMPRPLLQCILFCFDELKGAAMRLLTCIRFGPKLFLRSLDLFAVDFGRCARNKLSICCGFASEILLEFSMENVARLNHCFRSTNDAVGNQEATRKSCDDTKCETFQATVAHIFSDRLHECKRRIDGTHDAICSRHNAKTEDATGCCACSDCQVKTPVFELCRKRRCDFVVVIDA